MGNLCGVEGAVDHWIYVKTGDRKHAGTDANVKVILYDVKGQKSPEIKLDCIFRNDFERGQTDTFQAPGLMHMSDITHIEIWRDNSGVAPDWFCEVIMVNDVKKDKCFYFPIQKWLVAEYHYMVPQYNTSLPQFDEYPDQREQELDYKREVYQFTQAAPDLPMQIKKLPADEVFSDDYKWDLETQKLELLVRSALTRFTTGRWETLTDLIDVYKYSDTFPAPAGKDRWSNDAWFGAQRLIGCNPRMIKLCTALPENMGVTAEMLRPFLEGWSIKQIIDAKRLFIVDFKILDGLPTKDDRPLCAPIGLFFLNGDKQLIPIAIQLHQEIAPNNPVFLCNDHPFTWILAKMWFNHADSTIHQSLSHLGFTHLMMEGVCIAMHRHLATNHPIFKLLAPHFLFLLAINTRGLNFLISKDGWVDKTTTVGREGMFELIRRGIDEWRMDVHGNLQREIETRGVLDPKVLPNYSYRDDGILVWEAIENYVSKIVKHYYDTPEKIKEDKELQGWIATVGRPKEEGGVGIQGTPNKGQFKTALDIISVCTSIIFTCCAQHAATNFNQYDEYGFPPNYPALLMGEPPLDKLPRFEEDVVKTLPNKDITLDTMTVTKLLSMKATQSLGNWEFQYQYDPPALKAENELREQLELISKEIQSRNLRRDPLYIYTILDPAGIPNAISI